MGAWWRVSVRGLERWQWAVVAVVVLTIVVINKMVIGDTGSDWFSLLLAASMAGFGVLAAVHFISRRRL